MKKIISVLLALCMLSLVGCGTKKDTASKTESTAQTSSTVSAENCDYEWKTHPQDFKLIAFTFDDAPSFPDTTNNVTSNIIKTFKQYEGAGTLFIIGKKIEQNGSALLKFALKNGFELGNHSYGHDHMGAWDANSCKSNISRLNDELEERLGVKPRWFRTPFLDDSSSVFDACTELNMPVIYGSYKASLHDGTTDDNYNNEFIKTTCLENAYDGQIVLMHGFNKYTGLAIPIILKELYDQNYRFVTLSELFEYKGVTEIPTDHPIYDATCKQY